MSGDILVRKCETLEEFHGCVELQRQIWGEADLEVEPVTMFVVAAHTGGQVLGAFANGRMVGYTLAIAGLREGVPYLHSHMICGDILVRKCETLEEFHGCVELQRQIWGEADLEVEPVTMFVVAAHTGGQVLGAFANGRMVGYTLAIAGLREGVPYLHSHMTGV